VDLPLFVMIRPRPGDFFHSAPESELLIRQVTGFTTIGADGFVFGCLLQDRSVDMPLTRRLVEEAGELPCTIHRAFDEVRDHRRAIEDLVECGAARVLTSGGASTAVEGAGNLRSFVEHAAGRLIILPGGGVRPDNAEYILHETSAAELHSAARSESGVFDPMIARLLAGITHSSNSRTGRKTGTMPGEDFSKT